jgi:phosphohistidine swiveling domain-containing protein
MTQRHPPDNHSAAWLRGLDEIDGADLPLVGGKAYRLARLRQQGLNIPPGLVLTTHFFESHLAQARLTPLWAGSPDVAVTAEALGWLADTLKTRPLAQPLARALQQQLAAHFHPDVIQFAVRSSAIDEDQRDHTFAGIHLTELGVPRSAIPIAVSRCWASALSEAAIQYRQDHGMSIQGIKVAVLIQPMLKPTIAGVGFTLDPLTGNREELIIEAVPGLGHKLVTGEAVPYFYRLANQPPDFPLLEFRHPPGAPAGNGPLTTETRSQLAAILRQAEALLGEPQDVEWAVQEETLYLLQSRSVKTTDAPAPKPGQIWVRSHNTPFLPELPSPFWASLLERWQPQLIAALKALGFNTHDAVLMETLFLGRPYLNLDLVKWLAAQLGLNPAKAALPATLVDLAAVYTLNRRAAWQARALYRAAWRAAGQAEQTLDSTGRSLDTLRQMAGETDTPGDAVIYLRRYVALAGQFATSRLQIDLSLALTALLVSQLTGRPYARLLAGLPQPVDGFETALRQVAEDLPPNLPENVSLAALPAASADQLQALAAAYNYRGPFQADPAQPNYGDSPALILAAIRQIRRPSGSGDAHEITGWRATMARPLFTRMAHLLALRRTLETLSARSVATTRRWGVTIGQRWQAQGWLVESRDIFWLTLGEIEQVLTAGAARAVSLAATVEMRRTQSETFRAMQPPLTLQPDNLEALQFGTESGKDAAVVTIGLPVSPGQARGRVLVIDRPQQLAPQPDDVILVLPATGPEWLPLLHQAAGLIVETGGLLSHGSVIAREYGIPAVANIPYATRRYRSGDMVLVDGSTGVIQLLDTAAPLPDDETDA